MTVRLFHWLYDWWLCLGVILRHKMIFARASEYADFEIRATKLIMTLREIFPGRRFGFSQASNHSLECRGKYVTILEYRYRDDGVRAMPQVRICSFGPLGRFERHVADGNAACLVGAVDIPDRWPPFVDRDIVH